MIKSLIRATALSLITTAAVAQPFVKGIPDDLVAPCCQSPEYEVKASFHEDAQLEYQKNALGMARVFFEFAIKVGYHCSRPLENSTIVCTPWTPEKGPRITILTNYTPKHKLYSVTGLKVTHFDKGTWVPANPKVNDPEAIFFFAQLIIRVRQALREDLMKNNCVQNCQ